jgi:hypothetical protein
MHVRVSRSKPDERAPPARKFWLFIEQHRIKTTQKRKIIYFESRAGCVTAVGIAHTRIGACFARRAQVSIALLCA